MLIEVGDSVQARKGEYPNVAVREFPVAAIDGALVEGSVDGPVDTADGWTVEIIEKAPGNLHLPDTISEINARLRSDPLAPHVLVGKGTIWRDNGVLVPVTQILEWQAA